ncbi:hypothetical protein GCM10011325_46820 [Dyadobacter sediminis]|nr:hypothetical protein GCM10011325_46820 [Dyadobacter sediminis]
MNLGNNKVLSNIYYDNVESSSINVDGSVIGNKEAVLGYFKEVGSFPLLMVCAI